MTTTATRSPLSRLRQIRRLADLSLHEVARQTGIDPSHLSRIERGQAGLSAALLGRLVPVLGLTPEDLALIVAEEAEE